MKKKILFTGGGGAGAESLWRLLSGKYDLYFADACLNAISNTIPEDRKLQIPFANSENFVGTVRDLCCEFQIDTLVPGVDEELVQLCLSRKEGMPHLLLPSVDFVEMMLDKFRCATALKEKGLNAPNTLSISRAAEIGFPLIVKPKTGRGSRGVCTLRSQAEIDAYHVLYRTNSEDIIAQELKNGVEYTVLVAADRKGLLKAVIPVKVGQKKGITIRAETEVNKAVIEYSKLFHEVFMPTGIYNIQCILTSEGEIYPFEINPRVSTTFCLGIAAGFDPFSDDFEDGDALFLPQTGYALKRNWFNNISRIG